MVFRLAGAQVYLKQQTVINDKDPGNVSMLANLNQLTLPAQLDANGIQKYLDFFNMNYSPMSMNDTFDQLCQALSPFENQFFSALPESKSSVTCTTEKASGTTPAKFFINLISNGIAVMRCEINEVAYKTLLSKHVGFASLYDTNLKAGTQTFMLFALVYTLDQ